MGTATRSRTPSPQPVDSSRTPDVSQQEPRSHARGDLVGPTELPCPFGEPPGSEVGLVLALSGTALANNPPGDPLPVQGEPNCFGARVSHSASGHGLAPPEKIAAVEATLDALATGFDPPWEEWYVAYWEEHGVSVQSIQNWIKTNCA